MRTKCGWVWREWADQQSILSWETEGGSYDPWTGDALGRDNIIKTGFKRWYRPYMDQILYRVAGPATSLAGSRSSHTRMLTDQGYAGDRPASSFAAPTTLRLRFGSNPGEPVGHSSCGVRTTMK
jgi:hypothetical protein